MPGRGVARAAEREARVAVVPAAQGGDPAMRPRRVSVVSDPPWRPAWAYSFADPAAPPGVDHTRSLGRRPALLGVPEPLIAMRTPEGTIQVFDLATGWRVSSFAAGAFADVWLVRSHGSAVAIVGSSRTVGVWDPLTGRPMHALAEDVTVLAVGQSADGGALVVTRGADLCSVWDVATGALRYQLPNATLGGATGQYERGPGVRCRRIGDDTYGIALGADGMVRVWNLDTGDVLHLLAGHTTSAVDVIAQHHGPALLVIGGVDGLIRVYDIHTGVRLHLLSGHVGPVRAVACYVDDDGVPVAISGGFDATARVWDLNAGTLRLTREEADAEEVSTAAVARTSDGRRVAVTVGEGMRVWDPATGDEVSSAGALPFRDPYRIMMTVAGVKSATPVELADGNTVIVTTSQHAIRVWNLEDASPRHLLGVRDTTSALAAHLPDGPAMAVSGSATGVVRVWDLDSAALLHTLHGRTGGIRHLDCASLPDGTPVCVTVSQGGELQVWDLRQGTLLQKMHSQGVRPVNGLHTCALPNGATIAVAHYHKGAPQAWNLLDGQPHNLALHQETHGTWHSLVTLPDTTPVAVTLDGQQIRLWNLATLASVADVELLDAPDFVVCSPLPTVLAIAVKGKDARVYDLTSGERLHTLTGHQRTIKHAVCGLVGAAPVAVTVDDDRTVRTWNLTTGKHLHELSLTGWPQHIALTTDRLVVTDGTDIAAFTWTPTPDDVQA